ncbi:hypothetical protein ANN_18671 [Periplaneta americana]|uniref:Uncharacterized protein n=1 Tax=Periplaneta americana TaxID=6978 RepID=A0ABQ8SPE5_PERAM|nr:hypothetical protein ANN_18671 [Periplaneta americana]
MDLRNKSCNFRMSLKNVIEESKLSFYVTRSDRCILKRQNLGQSEFELDVPVVLVLHASINVQGACTVHGLTAISVAILPIDISSSVETKRKVRRIQIGNKRGIHLAKTMDIAKTLTKMWRTRSVDTYNLTNLRTFDGHSTPYHGFFYDFSTLPAQAVFDINQTEINVTAIVVNRAVTPVVHVPENQDGITNLLFKKTFAEKQLLDAKYATKNVLPHDLTGYVYIMYNDSDLTLSKRGETRSVNVKFVQSIPLTDPFAGRSSRPGWQVGRSRPLCTLPIKSRLKIDFGISYLRQHSFNPTAPDRNSSIALSKALGSDFPYSCLIIIYS